MPRYDITYICALFAVAISLFHYRLLLLFSALLPIDALRHADYATLPMRAAATLRVYAAAAIFIIAIMPIFAVTSRLITADAVVADARCLIFFRYARYYFFLRHDMLDDAAAMLDIFDACAPS